MEISETDWVTVGRGRDERSLAELALVLEARAIPHRRVARSQGAELQVPGRDRDRALAEIDGYARENAAAPPPRGRPIALIGRGWPGVAVYAGALMLFAVLLRQNAWGRDWLTVGRMDRMGFIDGQWWRAVTALTLHVDADHLLGNLAFGSFFGYFAARYCGAGLAWLAIVAAGTLGNVLNVALTAPEHRSIGASTAVFAALGLLAAFTWRRSLAESMSIRVRIAPLVAGVALLAYTGAGGANTDVGAHLTGFVAGLAAGVVLARFELATRPAAQFAFGIAAAATVAAAWTWALAAG